MPTLYRHRTPIAGLQYQHIFRHETKLIESCKVLFQMRQGHHVAHNCRTSTRLVCSTCSGCHITILCDIWRFSQDESRPSFIGVSESRTDENRGLPNNVTTASATSTGVSLVLLQTAKAWATGTTDSALVTRKSSSGHRKPADIYQMRVLGEALVPSSRYRRVKSEEEYLHIRKH